VSEYEKEIFSLAQQLLGKPRSKSEIPPSQPNAPSKLSESEVEVRPENADAPKVKETKTAAELARMIEDGLSKHPESRKDFVVTVYGGTLWRAMPTITPAAGAVRNPQEWRDLTEELAERLRKRNDLAWPQEGRVPPGVAASVKLDGST
jgi:hypothetical protein